MRPWGPRRVSEATQAEGQLADALSKFMLVVENYPELKANQNFLALQEELASTENKIAFARQNYNDQVLFYNNRIQMFPSNVVAGMFAFTKRDFFEIQTACRTGDSEGQLRLIAVTDRQNPVVKPLARTLRRVRGGYFFLVWADLR